MNRTITRRLIFTADEVKEALIDYVEKNSSHAPLATDDTVKFELNDAGAIMEWTDNNEVTLC